MCSAHHNVRMRTRITYPTILIEAIVDYAAFGANREVVILDEKQRGAFNQ